MSEHVKPANKFARRHYVMIANVIRKAMLQYQKSDGEVQQIWDVALALSCMFASDNGYFDKQKFLASCYPAEWTSIEFPKEAA
jgi:hypothetical protein